MDYIYKMVDGECVEYPYPTSEELTAAMEGGSGSGYVGYVQWQQDLESDCCSGGALRPAAPAWLRRRQRQAAAARLRPRAATEVPISRRAQV